MRRDNRGNSLLNVLTSVTIVSVLVGAVAVPKYVDYVQKSKHLADAYSALEIVNAFQRNVASGDFISQTKTDSVFMWGLNTDIPEKADSIDDSVLMELTAVPEIESLSSGIWVIDFNNATQCVESIQIHDSLSNESYLVYPNVEMFINDF